MQQNTMRDNQQRAHYHSEITIQQHSAAQEDKAEQNRSQDKMIYWPVTDVAYTCIVYMHV